MADLGRYLRRFRRLMAPPGRAGPMGVPSDRVADVNDELTDVLAAVDAITDEAQELLDRAQGEAQQRRESAHREASRIRADARQQAEADRAAAALAERDAVEGELASIADAADTEAAQVRARVAGRLDRLAEQVATQVLAADPTPGRQEVA